MKGTQLREMNLAELKIKLNENLPHYSYGELR